jgi:hypothetical protein
MKSKTAASEFPLLAPPSARGWGASARILALSPAAALLGAARVSVKGYHAEPPAGVSAEVRR